MNDNSLLALKALGQHVWLDNLSRTLLQNGELQRLIAEDGIDGLTSNPAIFQKALAGSPLYRNDLERLRESGLNAEARYEALIIPDIQAACDILWPSYQLSGGDSGFVSLEVSPALAHDMAGTEASAHRLRLLVARDNLLIKVPATAAGISAFERLTAAGFRVNVTLIFSLRHYEDVAQAYLRGAQRWMDSGGDAKRLRSVASVFISRVDTLVDKRLETSGSAASVSTRILQGKAGVALAKCCYQRYREIFHGRAFASLAAAGVRAQTPLWASTGSKNPAYSDVLYVESLIGPDTINTLPDATLTAFRTHGHAATTVTAEIDSAQSHFAALAALGIDPVEVGETLQIEGLRLFAEAYQASLAAVS
jgi:transaldolase